VKSNSLKKYQHDELATSFIWDKITPTIPRVIIHDEDPILGTSIATPNGSTSIHIDAISWFDTLG
jgi:hypothetical protein